jgi:hypothetical protein
MVDILVLNVSHVDINISIYRKIPLINPIELVKTLPQGSGIQLSPGKSDCTTKAREIVEISAAYMGRYGVGIEKWKYRVTSQLM